MAVAFFMTAALLTAGTSGVAAWVYGGDGDSFSPSSTTAFNWEKGSMPYLYQTDSAWANKPYAGGTVAENGCGPTCLTMVYIDLTGRNDLDPATMAAFSEKNGHVVSGMTSWTLMTEGAAALGLISDELPADETTVLSALSQGKPVICSVGPGDFTTTGHFIVLVGLDEYGKVEIRDPNSEKRSQQSWDLDRILPQCRNLWTFSAA